MSSVHNEETFFVWGVFLKNIQKAKEESRNRPRELSSSLCADPRVIVETR